MRKTLSLLAFVAAVGALACGCANTERKLGRGLNNTFEIVRGINRTLARTGIGIYEIVTAPIPPYDPLFTNHFAPAPVYPDNYRPSLLEDSLFATDTYIGYSGGDVIPFVPGSRFRIFDTY